MSAGIGVAVVVYVRKHAECHLCYAKVCDGGLDIVKVFERTGAWTLPVVDDDNCFVGFIRKSRVFTIYRELLADISND